MDHNVEPMHDLDQQPHHLHTRNSGRKRGSTKKMFIVGGVVVGVLLLAAGIFFLLKKDSKKTDQNQQQAAQQQQQAEDAEPTMDSAEAAQLQTYKSTTLNIEIKYRKDWTVAEDAEKKLLTLTSPKVVLNSGSNRKDPFTVKIGFGTSEEAQRNITNAAAARDSLLIAYDAPTESQRFYTNISYAGPAGDGAPYFKFFIVTGSVAMKAGNPFGNSIIIGDSDFMIRGGFGADQQNQLAYEPVPASELEQYGVYEQAINIVKSLKVY